MVRDDSSTLVNFYIPSGAGTSGSSSIFIDRCYIPCFVVGIATSPNQFRVPYPDHPGQTKVVNTQNVENISIDSCNVSSTKTAIAICQDQNRNVICTNLGVTYAKYAIDCTHYGSGPDNPLPSSVPTSAGPNTSFPARDFNYSKPRTFRPRKSAP